MTPPVNAVNWMTLNRNMGPGNVKNPKNARGKLTPEFHRAVARQNALEVVAETLLWRYNGTRPDGSKMVVYCGNQNVQTQARKTARALFSEILTKGVGDLWIEMQDLEYALDAAAKKKPDLQKSFNALLNHCHQIKADQFERRFPLSYGASGQPHGMGARPKRSPRGSGEGPSSRAARIQYGQEVLAQALDA